MPPKVLFVNNELSPELRNTWKAAPTDGTTMKPGADGIEFTIDAWKEPHDMWPRLWFLGPAIDLSAYTHVIVDVENPSAIPQNLVLGVQTNGVGQAVLLPPHKTTQITVDISNGVSIDQSAVSEIMLYVYRPLTTDTFVVKKVAAVNNPDITSERTALQQQLEETQRHFTALDQSLGKDQPQDDRVAATQSTLQEAQSTFTQASPGYVRKMQALLLTAQENIARVGMESRHADQWIWTAPLGVALRQGMLPSPQDKALNQIKDRVCLNQYKAIAVNISAAAKPQDVRFTMEAGTSPKNMFSLRPTLLAKARDSSMVSDAIGSKNFILDVKVTPYETQQVIVWVDTKIAGMRAGKYHANLKVLSSDNVQNIPLEIDIADVRLSDKTPLSIQNWSYFYMSSTTVTNGLEDQAVANLRDYGVNTWSFDYSQVPLPTINSVGEYTGLQQDAVPGFRKILELLKGHPDELFVVWLGFQRDEVRELLDKPGVLSPYLKDLHRILDEYKIPRKNQLLTFWDEPKLPEIREEMKWIHRIHAIDPDWRFYDNGSVVPTDPKDLENMAQHLDYWTPNWDQLFLTQPEPAKRYEDLPLRHSGSYRCLMSRNNRGVNIYEYYRLTSWYLMQHGFDSNGLWVYNVGAENVWDGTTGSSSGGILVYNNVGKLLTSRRWELFRESIDDYKLAEAAFGDGGVLDARKNMELKELCNEVVQNPQDVTCADKVRQQMISIAAKRKKHL